MIEIFFILAFVLLVSEAFNPTLGIQAILGFLFYVAGLWAFVQSDAETFYGFTLGNIITLGIIFFAAFVILLVYLRKNRHKKVETGVESLKGEEATVKSWSDTKGIVFIDGEDWRASGPDTIKSGDIVIIEGYKDLTLIVKQK
jgi:membrane-bound serine protease (ClpP class)